MNGPVIDLPAHSLGEAATRRAATKSLFGGFLAVLLGSAEVGAAEARRQRHHKKKRRCLAFQAPCRQNRRCCGKRTVCAFIDSIELGDRDRCCGPAGVPCRESTDCYGQLLCNITTGRCAVDL